MEMKCVVFVIIMRRYNIFFYCTLAKFIWRVIQLTFGLGPPNNIKNVFGAWVHNTNSANRQLLFVGIGVMLWAIWLNRNDVVFNKTLISSYMQVIFRGTHWAWTWALFQKEEKRKVLQTACWLIETFDNGDLRQAWIMV
jgi:hypothetical protein